jgi:hypothetical protein
VSREAVADLRSRTAAVLAKHHRGRAGNYSSALPRFLWMGRRLGCRCRASTGGRGQGQLHGHTFPSRCSGLPGTASTVKLNHPRSPARLADQSAISIAKSETGQAGAPR